MKIKAARFAVLWLLPSALVAQTPNIPTMDHEPHHHLALHNDYVKVFNVEVAPGDSIILHSHDQDTIAIAIGDQLVTVGIPGKTIPPSKNADGQVRLQRSGYIHSTLVGGDKPYHTVAVELMQPQTNFHNVCAEILPGQPQNCPVDLIKPGGAASSLPLLASDQTLASLVKVLPQQSMKVGESGPEVIVTLDAATISGTSKEPEKTMKPGEYVWLDGGAGHGRGFKNAGDKEARFIEIVFQQAKQP
jgi:quercetin dioxygenase-like cupin family protein